MSEQLSLVSWQIEKIRKGYLDSRRDEGLPTETGDGKAVVLLASFVLRDMWSVSNCSTKEIVRAWVDDFRSEYIQEVDPLGAEHQSFTDAIWACCSSVVSPAPYEPDKPAELLVGLETGAVDVQWRESDVTLRALELRQELIPHTFV